MCGLFGAVSNYLSSQEIENVINLGIISCVRGKDSSGIALISSSKKKKENFHIHLSKKTVSSAALLSNTDMIKFLHDKSKEDRFCLLGHSRYATIGSVTEMNAHPHMYNHDGRTIIGTHNGTIDSYVEKVKDSYTIKEDGKEVIKEYYRAVDPNASDSRVLFEKMSKIGPVKAIQDAEDKRGSLALAFVDYKEGTLNLYRNYLRNLFYCFSQDSSTVYWASDETIINVIKNGSDKWSVGHPILLQPHIIHSFKLGESARASLTKRDVRLTSAIILLEDRRNGANDEFEKDNFSSRFKEHQWLSENSSQNSEVNQKKVWTEVWTGYNPLIPLFEDEAKKKLSIGCSICTKVSPAWETSWWLSEIEYVCDNCYDSPLMKEYALAINDVKFIGSTVNWK